MSSRYLKDLEIRKSKIIHVYRNGDPYSRATFIILRLPEQIALERIIKAIEEKVKLPLNRPIRKLFEINGTIVDNAKQIEDGKYYIAASAENFCVMDYGHPANWILVGPVRTNKYANVHYVTKSEEESVPNKLRASNNVLATPKSVNPNPSSKKAQNKSTNKPQKKPIDIKKSVNKKMFVSEHVDNILGDDDLRKHSLDDKSDEIPKSDVEISDVHVKDESFKEEPRELDHSINQPENVFQPEENQNEDINQKKEVEIVTAEVTNEVDINKEEDHPIETDISHEPEEDNNEVFKENPVNQFDEEKEITKEQNDNNDENNHDNVVEDKVETNEDDSQHAYNEAATKIQATFRGYQVRNEMEKSKTSDFPEDSIDESGDISEILNNEDDNF